MRAERAETADADSAKQSQAASVTRAALWMSGSLASFTLIAVAGREAARSVSTGAIMFYRSWFALVVLLVVVLISGRGFAQFRTPQIHIHGLRSVIHFGAQYSWFYALPLISLAQLSAIEFTAPLWTALMAPLLLRERLTSWRLAAVALGFFGMFVTVRPDSADLSPGIVFAMLAAIGFAVHYILTKRLTRYDPAFTVIFYMTLAQAVLAAAITSSDLPIPDAPTAGWLFVIAICGLTAHFSIARAFSLADAIIVTPMDFLRLPLIAMVGIVLYAEPLNLWVLIGGGIVVLANFINVWSERRRAA